MTRDFFASQPGRTVSAVDRARCCDMTQHRPLEPVTAILAAFASHDLVALGEGTHGSSEPYAFRLALIGDPRFADSVNDIVVETEPSSCSCRTISYDWSRGSPCADRQIRSERRQLVAADYSAGCAPLTSWRWWWRRMCEHGSTLVRASGCTSAATATRSRSCSADDRLQ